MAKAHEHFQELEFRAEWERPRGDVEGDERHVAPFVPLLLFA